MKKFLCIVISAMLLFSFAAAETADTLQKKFVRQLTAGYGVRGYASIRAFGAAEWLNMLLPFTATDVQIRAIGEMQRDMSENVMDDDDWQIRLFAENSDGQEVGTTWIFGDPAGMYFQSELLPGETLAVPVEQIHLLYQLFKGEYAEIFFAFDPYEMKAPGANGNVSAYGAVAELLGIEAEAWESEWFPVLEKYLLHLDLWLSSYGDPSFVTGESGSLTMEATYTIPAADLKAEAKYIIGQMLFDNDFQNLMLPYVTMEQRVTYLNPGMVYFYEACIDALPLEGDVVLSREMSSQGDIVSTKVVLPIPPLPETLTAPIDETVAKMLELPYDDLLSGMNLLTIIQAGGEKSLVLSGEKRMVEVKALEMPVDEHTIGLDGTLRIMPNVGVDENTVSAAFSYSYGNRVWQDENYLDHDTTTFDFSIEPDLDMLNEDDPFRNAYVDFAPLALNYTVDYRNNPYQENSAVQINIDGKAKLPDAELNLEMVLRITTKLAMTQLNAQGAKNLLAMTEAERAEILTTMTTNAVNMMANLGASASAEVPEAAPTAVPTESSADAPAAEPTAVPPMTE